MRGYHVFHRDHRSTGGYLELVGPFAYPKWGAMQQATVLTFARAHAFALAYGGDVLAVGAPPPLDGESVPSFPGWGPFGLGASS